MIIRLLASHIGLDRSGFNHLSYISSMNRHLRYYLTIFLKTTSLWLYWLGWLSVNLIGPPHFFEKSSISFNNRNWSCHTDFSFNSNSSKSSSSNYRLERLLNPYDFSIISAISIRTNLQITSIATNDHWMGNSPKPLATSD